jgi:predicted Zn-dependent protease
MSVEPGRSVRVVVMRRLLALRVAALSLAVVSLACASLSVEDEKRLGVEAQRQVRQQFDMVRDRVIVQYIRNLGAELVAAGEPSPFDFRFYVVEDDSINAFALPGGALYVNTGTILKAKDVSELAGVLAHEIGHVTARHLADLYPKQRAVGLGVNIISIAAAILTGNPYVANAASMGSQVAAQAYLASFGQDAERESDSLAVATLIRANYDPNGMVTFFHTLMKETEGGLRVDFLSSHPATDERISLVEADIRAKEPLPRGVRRNDGGRLQIIQKRINLVIGTDADAR